MSGDWGGGHHSPPGWGSETPDYASREGVPDYYGPLSEGGIAHRPTCTWRTFRGNHLGSPSIVEAVVGTVNVWTCRLCGARVKWDGLRRLSDPEEDARQAEWRAEEHEAQQAAVRRRDAALGRIAPKAAAKAAGRRKKTVEPSQIRLAYDRSVLNGRDSMEGTAEELNMTYPTLKKRLNELDLGWPPTTWHPKETAERNITD